MSAGCRIRSVTDRKTGRTVRLLPPPHRDPAFVAAFDCAARTIADCEAISAVITVAMDARGACAVGWHVEQDCPLASGAVAAIALEAIRRRMLSRTEALSVCEDEGLIPVSS